MTNARLLATFARTSWRPAERRQERPPRKWAPPPPDPRCAIPGCPGRAVIETWICDDCFALLTPAECIYLGGEISRDERLEAVQDLYDDGAFAERCQAHPLDFP